MIKIYFLSSLGYLVGAPAHASVRLSPVKNENLLATEFSIHAYLQCKNATQMSNTAVFMLTLHKKRIKVELIYFVEFHVHLYFNIFLGRRLVFGNQGPPPSTLGGRSDILSLRQAHATQTEAAP